MSINVPLVVCVLLAYAYFTSLNKAMAGKGRRIALDQKTGRIVMVGAGKAKPVVTRPNVDPHRLAPPALISK